MKAINRFKKITAALALIAAVGLGQSYAQTAPKKMEKEAKKSEQKAKEINGTVKSWDQLLQSL